MDDAEQFLPLYLRFVKGVVDSSDLPLNVSRELLQQDEQVEAMRGALTRRALELLAKLANDDPEKYATFWKEFGRVLKEGVSEDPAIASASCRCCASPARTMPMTPRASASPTTWRACRPARSASTT